MTELNNTEKDECVQSEYEKEFQAMCDEIAYPYEKCIRVNEAVGKTVKFSKAIQNRSSGYVLIVFTDDTFVLLTTNDYLNDCSEITLPSNFYVQEILVDGGIVSQEKVDLYRNFYNKQDALREKEMEIEKLHELLDKYPEESKLFLK